MFCPNCGKELPDGSQFCDGCGSKTAGGNNVAASLGNMMANAQSTPGKMNFVGMGAAVLMLLCIFIPVYYIDAIFVKFNINIWACGFMGVISGILLIAIAAAGGFFSFAKNDQFVFYAGIAGLVVSFILTILFITKGFNVTLSFMGQTESGPLKEVADSGVPCGPGFGFFLLWIASIAMTISPTLRKKIPALQ